MDTILWSAKHAGPVLTVRVPMKKNKDWEQWVLLRADVHHDSIKCDINLEKQHLVQAQERGAMIFDLGDTFDVMQGRHDPRRNPDDLRPEYMKGEYYDVVVDHMIRFYKPYKDNFVMFAHGNHETKVKKHSNTDLTKRLAMGVGVLKGEYGGWVRFMFDFSKTQKYSKKLRYMHSGPGRNAVVTKGVLDVARISSWLTDADIVCIGHDHNQWIVPLEREGMTSKGRIVRKPVVYVKPPGYKDGWGKGDKGWEVEQARGPKPLGSVWLRFYWSDKLSDVQVEAILTER